MFLKGLMGVNRAATQIGKYCLAVKGLWRGNFLPIYQQMTKTKALCFPESEREEGQRAQGSTRRPALGPGSRVSRRPAGHAAPLGQVYKA